MTIRGRAGQFRGIVALAMLIAAGSAQAQSTTPAAYDGLQAIEIL